MWRIGYLFNTAEIIGGGELSFIELIDAIRRFEVLPLAFVPGSGEVMTRLKAIGVDVQESPWHPISAWSLACLPRRQARLAQWFRALKLDLVHTNGARCMLYAGPAAHRAGIPCVWHVRVLERDRILDRIRSHYATAIVANSHSVSDSLARTIGTAKQVKVIYNGIRSSPSQSIEALDLQREFGVPEGPVIVAVGRFTRWKRFEDLIQACAILEEKAVPFSCLLVGEALPSEKNYEIELRNLVNDLELTKVCFTGWRDDVLSILRAASVLVLPSRSEPFGRILVEAWICGVPVIATNAGGPAELISHGVDGLLVPVADQQTLSTAISSILEDRAFAERLAEAGSQRVTEFSLEKHAENILLVYRSLLNSTG